MLPTTVCEGFVDSHQHQEHDAEKGAYNAEGNKSVNHDVASLMSITDPLCGGPDKEISFQVCLEMRTNLFLVPLHPQLL